MIILYLMVLCMYKRGARNHGVSPRGSTNHRRCSTHTSRPFDLVLLVLPPLLIAPLLTSLEHQNHFLLLRSTCLLCLFYSPSWSSALLPLAFRILLRSPRLSPLAPLFFTAPLTSPHLNQVQSVFELPISTPL